MISAMALGRPGSSFTSVSVGSVLPTQRGSTKQHAAASGPLLPVKVGGCTCCKSLKKSASKMWCSFFHVLNSLGKQFGVAVPVPNHEALIYLAIPQIAHVQLQAHEHLQFAVFQPLQQQALHIGPGNSASASKERTGAPGSSKRWTNQQSSGSATATKNRNQNFRSFSLAKTAKQSMTGTLSL